MNGSYTSVRIPAAKNKFSNRKVELDGMRFDSAFEAKVWSRLKLEERVGEISDLQRQVRIPLVVNGQKVCDFVLDFVYVKDGKTVYADAKSAHTRTLRAYSIKKKLLKALYGHEVLEIMK